VDTPEMRRDDTDDPAVVVREQGGLDRADTGCRGDGTMRRVPGIGDHIGHDDLDTVAGGPSVDDQIVVDVLQKMVKQRRESITMYEQGNRPELAAQEQSEVEVIETFLPSQLSEDETKAAIEAIKTEVGAESVKDMGKVMAVLKERHGTVIDMSKASGLVKAALG